MIIKRKLPIEFHTAMSHEKIIKAISQRFCETDIVVDRDEAYGGRVRHYAPLLLKILFFFNTKPEKTPFQGFLATRSM